MLASHSGLGVGIREFRPAPTRGCTSGQPSFVCHTYGIEHGFEPDNADYDNGYPKHRGYRLDGKMHGSWEFYRRDGSIMRSGEFDRGKRVGVWKTFDRSGALVKETDFPRQ